MNFVKFCCISEWIGSRYYTIDLLYASSFIMMLTVNQTIKSKNLSLNYVHTFSWAYHHYHLMCILWKLRINMHELIIKPWKFLLMQITFHANEMKKLKEKDNNKKSALRSNDLPRKWHNYACHQLWSPLVSLSIDFHRRFIHWTAD